MLAEQIMLGDEVKFYEYLKTFATHLPRKKKSAIGTASAYAIGVVLTRLERRGVFISYEFAQYIANFEYDKYWVRLLMPALLINIKYVQHLLGVEPCEQTPEHHKWLASLHDNAVQNQKPTQKSLESQIVHLPEFRLQDDTSLRYLNVLNIYRELSHSPMGPWWWYDFEDSHGAFPSPMSVSAYVHQMQTGMTCNLPSVIQGMDLISYVEKLFPTATRRTEKKATSDSVPVAVMGDSHAAGVSTHINLAQAINRMQRNGVSVNMSSISVPTVMNVPRGLGKTNQVMHATTSTTIQGRTANRMCIDEVCIDAGGGVVERAETFRELKAMHIKFNTQGKEKVPRGSFACIPGHNSVEPWKNKSKRGRNK